MLTELPVCQGAATGAHHVSLQLREQTVSPASCRLHLGLDLQQQEQVQEHTLELETQGTTLASLVS